MQPRRKSTLVATAALLAAVAATATTAATSEPSSSSASPSWWQRRRRLAPAATTLPGAIAPLGYTEYLMAEGVKKKPTVSGGIGDIRSGESASYIVKVAKAGFFTVSYSLASKAVAQPSMYVVEGTDCSGADAVPLSPLSAAAFSSGAPNLYATLRAAAAAKPFFLQAGTQTVTVCFASGGHNFGGMTFVEATGEGMVQPPTPAPETLQPSPAPASSSDGGFSSNTDDFECYDGAVWESVNGEITLNGNAFQIKGANWAGFDGKMANLHGLWAVTMGSVLDIMRSHGINALRIPISLQVALTPTQKVDPDGCISLDGVATCAASGLSWDNLNMLFDESAKRGILIMLDIHNLEPDNNEENELWYDDTYSEDQFVAGWKVLLDKFEGKPNFLGIDLFNEPHGSASWGIGDVATDWGLAAARTIKTLAASNPDFTGLFFVEGVWENSDSPYTGEDGSYDHWWGGNLEGLWNHPITAAGVGGDAVLKRLVYAPHSYGTDVWYDQNFFESSDFPDNMPAVWDTQLGYIEKLTGGRAVVLGEWGGSYTGKDKILQDALVAYLAKNCMSDAFWWAINPDSGDTGGLLLKDWKTVNAAKFSVLAKLQPDPSRFTKPLASGGEYCVHWGSYASASCAAGTG